MDAEAAQLTTQARQLASDGCYAKAFDTYINTFEKFPDIKDQLEPEFRLLLNKLNQSLVITKKVGDIFFNFERAIIAYPGNIYLLNDIGKYLYKYGYYIEACCHFQKALKADSGYVAAEKNLNSVKNFLIERWHFRMLNDRVRNDAYYKAITSAIRPRKDTILDLGTGTGLLSMFATECTPAALTACDASEIMTEIASCAFHDYNMMLNLVVTNMSTSMDYRDIGGKRSIIITELFDAGLFGEHILETIDHAWEYLISINGRIIPGKADFFAVGANCDFLNLKYQLSKSAKTILNITDLAVHVSSADPYDSEDVHLFKNVTYLTEPESVIKIDFNNAAQVKEMVNNKNPFEVNFKVKKSGEINVIIGWFDLHLSPEIMITTSPTSENRANAWQQAIFFDFIPKNVSENEKVSVKFNITDNKLSMIPESKPVITRISVEMLRFLNDADYINKIETTIDLSCDYLGQVAVISEVSIADLSPFPYYGLLMLKHGAQSLMCYAKTQEDKKFIKKVFEENKIPMSKVTILVAEELENNAFQNLKFHAIYYNIIDLCGDINIEHKDIANHLKSAHLVPGGLMLPSKVTLMGQIIESNWLDINNRIYDSNLRDYKIAKYMNKYQVSQNFHVDFDNLEYEEMSEVTDIGNVTTELKPEEIIVPVIKDGNANAILCWYTLELMKGKGCETVTTKRPNSFVDGMVFLAYPRLLMKKGQHSTILRCVDSDGAFKLVIDTSNT